MDHTIPRRIRAGRPGLALLLAVAACAGPGSGGEGAGDLRASDGVLADAGLQTVVEAQGRRDAAALVAFLADPGAPVRARAAFALASVQDPGTVSALAAALRDVDPGVRGDAAFALGRIGDPSTVTSLAEAFGAEADATVRAALVEALGRIRAPDASAALLGLALQADEEVHRVRALARLGAVGGVATREAQDHLFAHLDHGDPAVRAAAAYYFGRLADPGPWSARVARLREALDGYAATDLAAAYLVQALGRLGDPSDGARLRSWAADARDWRTRVNAVAALGTLPPDPANREALLAALDDPAGLVAVGAAQALTRGSPLPSELQRMKAWIGAHPDAWQVYAPLLVVLARSDEREFVFGWLDAVPEGDARRWEAGLQALGFMPGQEAVERLQRAAASPDPAIQGGAVSALQQRWAQDRAFAGHTQAYFDIFSQVLGGGSAQARFSAAQALSDPLFGPLNPGEVLIRAYRGMSAPGDVEPMIAVLESLGRIGSPEAASVLNEAARHPHPVVRRAGAAALEGLGLEVPPVPSGAGVDEGAAPTGAPTWTVDWADLASLGTAPRLRLETARGAVVLRLLPEEAPFTVHAVTRLARDGAYDGTPLHRVVPNFVAQGGDVTSRDGFGTPGFTLPTELTRLAFGEGVAGMASSGKDTEGSQFFVTHSAQPHLDGGYTAFGWVVEGMDVVGRLMPWDVIVKATVERGG